MPAQKNRTLRIVVPIIVIGIAALIVIASFLSSSNTKQKQAAAPVDTAHPGETPGSTPPNALPAPPEPPAEPSTTLAESTPTLSAPDDTASATTPSDASTPTSWTAQTFPAPSADELPVLGSLDPTSGYRLQVRLTAVGAGVEQVLSAQYRDTIKKNTGPYLIQRRIDAAVPLAIIGVTIDGQWLDLFSRSDTERVWRAVGSAPSAAAFEAIIQDASGADAIRLRRSYSLALDSYDLTVSLAVENLTPTPHDIRVYTMGPVELPADTGGYNINLQRVRFGGLLSQRRDPSRSIVEADTKLLSHDTAIQVSQRPNRLLWPNDKLYPDMGEVAWVAQTNRYFGFIVHSLPGDAEPASLWAAREVFAKSLPIFDSRGRPTGLYLEMQSEPITIAPGATRTLPMGVYAGPTAERYLDADANPLYDRLSLDDIVIYQITGGFCGICTFQWLGELLFAFLNILHKYVVFDWALAIMVLVVVVRGILHPITKKSQISMMRFGKQMQALAPKQKALQEKYKDDRVKLQQEMARLMREEGVNYANMLGCLPMFLQTPIWIALYAMLYIAFELRHEPAFFGVVQSVFPNWSFLGDLSVGDHFIEFSRPLVTLPLMGSITGINILPLLLGVVFYVQQKYMTPPSATQLTPEQQSQQKMMKVMMIVLFPVMMYNAPSALSIYFITNSTLGILESRYIRSHVDQDKLVPEKPKHSGLGRKKVTNRAQRRDEPRNRFKDRG